MQASVHYPFIPEFTAYRGVKGAVPKAKVVSDRELTLPLFPTMTAAQCDYVCESLRKALS